MRRRAVVLALVGALGVGIGGCSRAPDLNPNHTTGAGVPRLTVLVDAGIAPRLVPAFAGLARREQVRYTTGTPAAIATTIKDGQPVDAVVLRTGPALDRVRDELVVPPTRLGLLGSTTYWAGAVSPEGLKLVTYYTTRAGRSALNKIGLSVTGVHLAQPLPSAAAPPVGNRWSHGQGT